VATRTLRSQITDVKVARREISDVEPGPKRPPVIGKAVLLIMIVVLDLDFERQKL